MVLGGSGADWWGLTGLVPCWAGGGVDIETGAWCNESAVWVRSCERNEGGGGEQECGMRRHVVRVKVQPHDVLARLSRVLACCGWPGLAWPLCVLLQCTQ